MKAFRDIEQLSAYLDGQLNPSDSARVESRLKTDRELASAYNDIRQAKSILQKLPARKSPRNFTLTRKMVGLKPPLPRAYPTFRFATAFATILFAFTVAVNSVVPRIGFGASAPNYGSGGGSDTTMLEAPMMSAAATEAPAAEEAVAQEMMPVATTEPEVSADAANTERSTETPTEKEPVLESPEQFEGQREALLIPVLWQVILLSVIVIGLLGLFLMSQSAKRKWQ